MISRRPSGSEKVGSSEANGDGGTTSTGPRLPKICKTFGASSDWPPSTSTPCPCTGNPSPKIRLDPRTRLATENRICLYLDISRLLVENVSLIGKMVLVMLLTWQVLGNRCPCILSWCPDFFRTGERFPVAIRITQHLENQDRHGRPGANH